MAVGNVHCVVLVAVVLCCQSAAVLGAVVAHGQIFNLPPECRGLLNDLWLNGYGGTNITTVANVTTIGVPIKKSTDNSATCDRDCQSDCRTTIQSALDAEVPAECPGDDEVRDCFRVAKDLWVNFVNNCILFNTQLTSNLQKNVQLTKDLGAIKAEGGTGLGSGTTGEAEGGKPATGADTSSSGTGIYTDNGCFPPLDATDEFSVWVDGTYVPDNGAGALKFAGAVVSAALAAAVMLVALV